MNRFLAHLLIAAPALLLNPMIAAARQDSALNHADRAFVKQAVHGLYSEIELGKLSQRKAVNVEVKRFGRRMVRDHQQDLRRLQAIGRQEGIALPKGPNRKHHLKAIFLALRKKSRFDRAFMRQMVRDHRLYVSDFYLEARDGRNVALRQFANGTLPEFRRHLKSAEGIRRKL